MQIFKQSSHNIRGSFSEIAARIKVVRIRFWWAILLSAALHRLPFALFPGEAFLDLKRACMVLSYLLLFWALSANLNFRSMRLIAVGTLLNFIAIIANRCLMPVSPEARELAQMTALDPSRFGMVLPEGSGIYLPIDQTNLWFFTDIIPAHYLGGVFSAGDILIVFGFVLFAVEIAFSRKWLSHDEQSLYSRGTESNRRIKADNAVNNPMAE
jgi:hypothetical protein